MTAAIREALQNCRAAEREQALFYRSLAAEAEQCDEPDLAQRFHDLHADEQHHLSRITARLLELDVAPAELPRKLSSSPMLARWRTDAARREQAEVARYRALLNERLDSATRSLLEQILETELHHERELGGKWMPA